MRPLLSALFALWLLISLYFLAVMLASAKPGPREILPDPAGVWGGARGDSLYLVTITADGAKWRSRWENEDGRLCWSGLLIRDGAGFIEKYDPAVSACEDWTWKAAGKGFAGKDDWKLTPGESDF